jgi:hypothetical protein
MAAAEAEETEETPLPTHHTLTHGSERIVKMIQEVKNLSYELVTLQQQIKEANHKDKDKPFMAEFGGVKVPLTHDQLIDAKRKQVRAVFDLLDSSMSKFRVDFNEFIKTTIPPHEPIRAAGILKNTDATRAADVGEVGPETAVPRRRPNKPVDGQGSFSDERDLRS